MNKAFGGSLLGDSFFDSSISSFGSGNTISVEEDEDDQFKYIVINAKGVDKENLKIDVTDGMVNISGEIKQSSDDQSVGSYSRSSFVSRFNKSFNIPYGVDANKVKIDQNNDKIIIKFPKEKV